MIEPMKTIREIFEKHSESYETLPDHVGQEGGGLVDAITFDQFQQSISDYEASKWVKLSELSLPKENTYVTFYREDAGVFAGYYGCLDEVLDDKKKEGLYKDGLTEEDMFAIRFYFHDMAGGGLLELDELPTHFQEIPTRPTK